uniref:beta-N-acetylhexosaminidase n=1 Tax=Palpitomonas bilix TaxID=652834 RepID=A0A7S3D3D5_9EUKA|mmetsp:Transcript_20222/g.51683  ORF Transcript_20222/g.51683 Transcript_20222/m.51683 type:complete len:205 (+) Transcript_20222:189-803(+)
MKEKGIPDGDGLLSYFVGRVHKNIAAVAPPLIQYQEVFEAGFRDSNAASNAAGTIFHVWKASSPAPADAIQDITAAGYRVVVSNSNYWYLNEGFGRLGTDTYTRWEDVYEHGIIDNITLTSAQKDLVIGGEGCLWGEQIDEVNLEQKAWPRTLAIAERLWSSQEMNSSQMALPRFFTHTCLLRSRGVQASPTNWGSCQIAANRQ